MYIKKHLHDPALLVPSAADFFTAESKQFVGAEISTKNMASDNEVELQYSTKFEDLDIPEGNIYNCIRSK